MTAPPYVSAEATVAGIAAEAVESDFGPVEDFPVTASTQAASNLDKLCELYEAKRVWTTDAVHMSMFVDIASEPRVSIRVNIAQFVGKRHGRQKDKGRKMYFADFNENDDDFRRRKLYPAFQKACRLAGFKATNNGWEAGEQRVRFTCSRTRHFRRTASAVNEHEETAVAGDTNRRRRNRTTSRPLAKEDQCHFMMPIFWDEVEKLWYMWERSAGNLQHNGHCELDPEEVKVSLSQLSDEDRELAFKMFNVNANTPTTQAFLE
jgi:hypothetical protein